MSSPQATGRSGLVLRPSLPKRLEWFSPWMIMGSVCILGAILLVLTVKHVQRQREFMVRTLVSEGNVLMSSLEAGTRTGMMGMGWGRRQLQVLMEQTSQQPDVLYVALVLCDGSVVAHSDPERVGTLLSHPLPPLGSDQVQHRFIDGERRIFEVIRTYQPWHMRQPHRGRGDLACAPSHAEVIENSFLVVGLDPTPFESAIHHDVQQMMLLSGVLFLIGAAAFVSLMWAQHYRKARRSLQDIRAFTSTILNQMPVGLIATDLQGSIQRANDAAAIILKQKVESNRSIQEFPCFSVMAMQLNDSDSVIEEEVVCAVNDSLKVPLHVIAAHMGDGQGRVVGYVFLFTDMTNIRQLEDRLHRSERLAALGRLAAGVAHEIRNPLSSIKGFAAILAGKVRGDAQGRQIAQVMQQEVERLDRVISELIHFARPTELHRRSCSCLDLVQHTLKLVERDALQLGVSIDVHIQPEDLPAEVDPDRFAQVLLNLYLNALQAMETGGRLAIDVRRQGDQLLWMVSDTGKGISEQDLSHIFDPYFTTKPHGVGLGLAIVHKLVEAHGGDIEVVSAVFQGTTFTVRLPVDWDKAAAA